jgi:transposase
MSIPGVGQLTALAFVAAIDDPFRIRRSRDVGAYLGLGPQAVSVWRGKNDAADAAAICEAMSRPNMRFVAVKSEDQQATLAHKTRQLLISSAR